MRSNLWKAPINRPKRAKKSGAVQLKITEIDVRLIDANFRNLIITQIHTDEGITGVSEVVTKRFDDATLNGVRNLTENIGLIGKDLRQPNLHLERMYRDNQWTIGTISVSAISAIEMAMWDIKGKEVGKPVYELLEDLPL